MQLINVWFHRANCKFLTNEYVIKREIIGINSIFKCFPWKTPIIFHFYVSIDRYYELQIKNDI